MKSFRIVGSVLVLGLAVAGPARAQAPTPTSAPAASAAQDIASAAGDARATLADVLQKLKQKKKGPSAEVNASYMGDLESCLGFLDTISTAARASRLEDAIAPAVAGFNASASIATTAPLNAGAAFDAMADKDLAKAKALADLHFGWAQLAIGQMNVFHAMLMQIAEKGAGTARSAVFEAMAGTAPTTKVPARVQQILQTAYAAESDTTARSRMKTTLAQLGMGLEPAK